MEVMSSSLMNSKEEIGRLSVDYNPSVWGDYFLRNPVPFFSSDERNESSVRQRVDKLLREVKNLFTNVTIFKDELKLLELIDSVQRLGIGYHFEDQIDERLKGLMTHYSDSNEIDEKDLHAVALKFRLLRQHGYPVTSEIFSSFKDDEGIFKSILAEDVRGLLSLYEACFVGTHEDIILDEARSFSTNNLLRSQSRCNQQQGSDSDSALKKLVSHALELPLHKRIPRLEARYYISFYEEDNEQKNDKLLELAKLDFNLLQSIHYDEIRSLSIWWKEIDFDKKYSFSRDRLVEGYFWSLSVIFEPQYSMARKLVTKIVSLLTITDDLFDVYGTLNELRPYADAAARWDVKAAEKLIDCMKSNFHDHDKFFQDSEYELSCCGYPDRVRYIKKMFQDVPNAYLAEAVWRDNGYTPTMNEYLQVSIKTTCYNLMACAAFVGMTDFATNEVLEWIATFPKFTYHSSYISRLKDDLLSQELEQKRKHVASIVQCYMKDCDATIEEACQGLTKILDYEWKSLNKEFLNLRSNFSKNILVRVVNFARFIEMTYNIQDKFTHSTYLKDYISSVLVEPIV